MPKLSKKDNAHNHGNWPVVEGLKASWLSVSVDNGILDIQCICEGWDQGYMLWTMMSVVSMAMERKLVVKLLGRYIKVLCILSPEMLILPTKVSYSRLCGKCFMY